MASQTITLTGGWQSLGAGPLKLQPKSAGGAWIVAAASQPSGTSGDYYLFPAQVQNFETSDTYWALPDRAGSLIGVEQISLSGGGVANPSTIVSGVQAATASAVALPSQTLVNGVVLKADAANTSTIYVGPSGVTTSTGYPLKAGEAISYAVTNLSAIYMIGTNTTDILHFTGN